jgi:hypothetical protein
MTMREPLYEPACHHVVGKRPVAVKEHHGFALPALHIMQAYPIDVEEPPARRMAALGCLRLTVIGVGRTPQNGGGAQQRRPKPAAVLPMAARRRKGS